MAYSVIKPAEHAQHVQQMLELATNPGLQRSRALGALKKIGKGYAFLISYGKGTAVINGEGEAYEGRVDSYAEAGDNKAKTSEPTAAGRSVVHDDPAGMEVGIATELSKVVVAGSAPMNKAVDSMHIPCGICVIVAKGGAGKTPLAHHLAAANVSEYATIRVGEPFAGYTTNRQTVARDLGRALISHSDIVLDSIKDLLAESGGLMKGGIARAALTDLSAWATQAAALGCTIYIPLNPSGDGELIKMMIEVAKSNATMTVSHISDDTWEYSARTGEGLERVSGKYRFSRRVEKQSTREKEMLMQFDASSIDSDRFSGLLQRSRSI